MRRSFFMYSKLNSDASRATDCCASSPLCLSTARKRQHRAVPLPTENEISEFLAETAYLLTLTPALLIASIIYLERLVTVGLPLFALSWRPITLGAIVLADKAWREPAGGVTYIAQAVPLLERDELAFLEGQVSPSHRTHEPRLGPFVDALRMHMLPGVRCAVAAASEARPRHHARLVHAFLFRVAHVARHGAVAIIRALPSARFVA